MLCESSVYRRGVVEVFAPNNIVLFTLFGIKEKLPEHKKKSISV